jgi:hypothetical protein
VDGGLPAPVAVIAMRASITANSHAGGNFEFDTQKNAAREEPHFFVQKLLRRRGIDKAE